MTYLEAVKAVAEAVETVVQEQDARKAIPVGRLLAAHVYAAEALAVSAVKRAEEASGIAYIAECEARTIQEEADRKGMAAAEKRAVAREIEASTHCMLKEPGK